MEHFKLFLVLILLLPLGNSFWVGAEDTCDCDYIRYSSFNGIEHEWLNITIWDDGYYEVSSDNEYYHGLEAKLLMNPWDFVTNHPDFDLFFTSNLMEENPHKILEIKYHDKHNTQAINMVDLAADGLIPMIGSILYRATGYGNDYLVWPVDIQVWVMESFPEQYGIEVLFQRGNDLLDYVHEENATLIVSDHEIFDDEVLQIRSNIIHAIYSESKLVSIAAGGFTSKISFSTFMLGKEYRPSELHFTILMDSGEYLYYTTTEHQ
ncbi:MAG: hypothetical protein ACXAD7_19130, partial [Candidatus Kariarchaeaceae archaeon]